MNIETGKKWINSAKNLTYTNALIMRYLAQGYANKFLIKDDLVRRQKSITFVSGEAKKIVDYAGFDVQVNYSRPDLFSSGKRYFMVCNHMSYMDIVCLGAQMPAVFVTSVEMKNTPFLGDIAAFGGSYFVERRDRSKVPGEVADLAKLMQQGFHVFVFPEATSTNGLDMIPFKRSMFRAAIAAGVDVLPICIRYEEIDGEPFCEENHKLVSWYGDMGFGSHYLRIMQLKSLKISINYLDPISSVEFPDRNVLADESFAQINKKYFEGREHIRRPRNAN